MENRVKTFAEQKRQRGKTRKRLIRLMIGGGGDTVATDMSNTQAIQECNSL